MVPLSEKKKNEDEKEISSFNTYHHIEHARLLNHNSVANLVVNVKVGLLVVAGGGLELHDQLGGELEASLEGSAQGRVRDLSIGSLGLGGGVGLLQVIGVDSGGGLLDLGGVLGAVLGGLKGGDEGGNVGHCG